MSKDIVERLEHWPAAPKEEYPVLIENSLAEIRRLRARVEELEGALKAAASWVFGGEATNAGGADGQALQDFQAVVAQVRSALAARTQEGESDGPH